MIPTRGDNDMSEQRQWRIDDRGASEVIGAVLIIGMVITGSLIVVYFGADTIDRSEQGQSDESAQIGIQEIDSRLSTLASSSAATTVNFEIGSNIERNAYLTEDEGYLSITVDEQSACSVEEPLDSVRFERDDGQLIAYEAGGTWVKSQRNGTVLRTAPDVSYRNGTIDVSLLNMTGQVQGGVNQAVADVNTSRVDTKNAVNTLMQGECVRPDNVTMQVQSDFYRAWADYLESETGLQRGTPAVSGDSYLTVDESTETVTVFLNQSALPRRTDDARNNVVNVTGADYMKDVSITDDGIRVTKGVDNTYTVYSEPLSERPELGTVRRIPQANNVTRPPLDVVFVVDESGSMGSSASVSGDSKAVAVRKAMRNFTTYLDSDMDRVSLVGFYQNHPNFGKVYRTNDQMWTSDFATFNSSTVTKTKYSGGTWTAGGMKKAASLVSLRSNETRNRIVVLLTDGVNNQDSEWHVDTKHFDCNWWESDCDSDNYHEFDGDEFYRSNGATVELADRLNRTGTVTYTVGFGTGTINEEFLNATAIQGGGEYNFAVNQQALEEVFESIAQEVSNTEQVGHYGMTTNLSTNQTVNPPQITGDTSRIATVTDDDGEEWTNINDPTAPSTFSHAFAVSGGDMVNFTAERYRCDKWVGTGQSKVVNGSSVPVTRCAEMNTTDPTVVDGDNVTIFTKDDSATFNDFLDNTTSAEWQTNLTQALDNYGGLYNETSQKLTLQSNQVLVLYDFPDGKNTDNRMLMLYSIGLSEEEARPTGIIDFDVDNVEISS